MQRSSNHSGNSISTQPCASSYVRVQIPESKSRCNSYSFEATVWAQEHKLQAQRIPFQMRTHSKNCCTRKQERQRCTGRPRLSSRLWHTQQRHASVAKRQNQMRCGLPKYQGLSYSCPRRRRLAENEIKHRD